MKLTHDLHGLRERLGKHLHLDALTKRSAGRPADAAREWVIVYRTAHGFCCLYRGEPVEFAEMLDVQVWAEDRDVQTYFIGL